MSEKLAQLLNSAIKRWTAKTPKTYTLIMDVSLGIAIGSSLVQAIPYILPMVVLPHWVIPVAGGLAIFFSKFQTEK